MLNSDMLLLVVSDSYATPWTVAHQAPLFVEFPRQEYWSGFPFPSPGDLLDPGTEPASPALAGGFFTTSATWEAHMVYVCVCVYTHTYTEKTLPSVS